MSLLAARSLGAGAQRRRYAENDLSGLVDLNIGQFGDRDLGDSKFRTAQRLANLISVFCALTWRVFWMTMLNR
ncbi:hypothetical protein [Bradyrhizobium valentinum]|uniref:Uncharacterized protein n=1 Tax=Bradyrhizobium valentinum TaxID=1518501 RepID=A0A0R3K7I5_9BRAD|nr:hypothetical protein [Bradyrhizobium valentinum]KRQ88946.1 hypothetical protein CP49_41250 [Bradyrhizobium valentinum]